MTIYDFNFKEPFANGADSSEIQPFPDENRGLGIAFVQTDGKPEMKGLNGLFNKITKALLSLRQNGLLGWVNDIEYIQGGFVVEGRKLYQAKVNNTNRKPSESQSDWELWTNASNISVDANGNISKDSKLDGSFTLKVEDADVRKKGVAQFANAADVINKVSTLVAITPKNASDISISTDIGISQTWKNVIGSRSLGVNYTNFTNKPIMISFGLIEIDNSRNLTAIVDGVTVAMLSIKVNWSQTKTASFIVPPNSSYRIEGNLISLWAELS